MTVNIRSKGSVNVGGIDLLAKLAELESKNTELEERIVTLERRMDLIEQQDKKKR